ncbi:hypothetical protein [Streptomyces sp. PanSC9]|nr:hypothetical protein [Streptomyces sp. PanSC9]
MHLRAGRGTDHRSRAVLETDTDLCAGRRGWKSGGLLATGYRH